MLKNKVINTIEKYNLLQQNDTIVVAVSGGPDSMCLLSVLLELKEKFKIKEIVVAHINHLLREEAELETQYVKEFCEKRKLRCFVKYIDIKEISIKNKIGEEQAGREERYKFFDEVYKKVNATKIAIAHNYNDNAETVLMHLIRGSGISGLSGIKPFRDNKYIRPIIKCNRAEIEEYCDLRNINPKYDKSNLDNTYIRNKIRNEFIPYIQKEYNPNIIETLNRLSDLVLEEEEYLNIVIQDSYKDILLEEDKNKIKISLNKFNILDNCIKSRIIFYVIKKIFGDSKGLEKINIDDIIKMCKNNIGNKYLMPKKDLKIFLKSGVVSFEKV